MFRPSPVFMQLDCSAHLDGIALSSTLVAVLPLMM
jgi:hypothetical protein